MRGSNNLDKEEIIMLIGLIIILIMNVIGIYYLYNK